MYSFWITYKSCIFAKANIEHKETPIPMTWFCVELKTIVYFDILIFWYLTIKSRQTISQQLFWYLQYFTSKRRKTIYNERYIKIFWQCYVREFLGLNWEEMTPRIFWYLDILIFHFELGGNDSKQELDLSPSFTGKLNLWRKDWMFWWQWWQCFDDYGNDDDYDDYDDDHNNVLWKDPMFGW